jgi:hypothetical protein
MKKTIETRENEGGAGQPGARKAASHRTLLVGMMYASTIVVVLMIVSKL